MRGRNGYRGRTQSRTERYVQEEASWTPTAVTMPDGAKYAGEYLAEVRRIHEQ